MRRTRSSRWSSHKAGVALVYHGVADAPGDPRRTLVPVMSRRLFEAQLRHVVGRYRVVSASELLPAAFNRRRGGPLPVALAFDDDLRSHHHTVAPILLRARVPASFFLCGACLDGPQSFWWEDLEALLERGGAPVRLCSAPELDLEPLRSGAPGAAQRVAEAIERLPPARRDAVAAELRSLAGPLDPDHGVGEGEVRALVAAGFEIGFHTRRHYLLSTLDDAELEPALVEGKAQLEAVAGGPITMIAYPHGKADSRVAAAARAAGYAYGFTGDPHAAGPCTDPLLIGRLEPSHSSLEEFVRALEAALAADPV